METMGSLPKSFILLIFIISANFAHAAAPQRIIVIDTDDSPGNTYIDVVQADDGSFQSLVYESTPTLTFTLNDLQDTTETLKQASGKDVIQLKLDPSFDPITGGYVTVPFLNNGITGNYEDFRILIHIQGDVITCTSAPDANDAQSDGNSFTSVFNKLFMWKNTLFGKEIGIDRVTPSLVSVDEVVNGPAPALTQKTL
jgi:hypothetical protein